MCRKLSFASDPFQEIQKRANNKKRSLLGSRKSGSIIGQLLKTSFHDPKNHAIGGSTTELSPVWWRWDLLPLEHCSIAELKPNFTENGMFSWALPTLWCPAEYICTLLFSPPSLRLGNPTVRKEIWILSEFHSLSHSQKYMLSIYLVAICTRSDVGYFRHC